MDGRNAMLMPLGEITKDLDCIKYLNLFVGSKEEGVVPLMKSCLKIFQIFFGTTGVNFKRLRPP